MNESMSKKPGEVFVLQLLEHLRGKESRKGGSFTRHALAVGRKGEIPNTWMEGRGKFESLDRIQVAPIYPSQAAASSSPLLMLKGGEQA